MIKRSPSRNNRSKGVKIKHVLQIILLLGVCFWLIYQVKHSHDKKREFDENDAKVSVGTQTLKLGRKDLHQGKVEVVQNERHEEEEDDENIIEDEDKHESEEKGDNQGVRGRGDEQEEDERGGGDNEIDENDQEQSAVDTDPEEEFMDEEKENNNKGEEKHGSVENHKSHEAREEQYKGDDASSAVAHDTSTTSTETESLLENYDENSEMNITKSENRPNYTEESNRNQHSSKFNITEAELLGGTSSNATFSKESGSDSLSKAVDGSRLDNFTMTYSNSHSEAGTNLTIVIPGSSNNLTGTSTNTISELNRMVILPESNLTVKNVPQEGLEQDGNRVSEENHPGSYSTFPLEAEKGESSSVEGGELEKSTKSVASNETENNNLAEMSETNKTGNILNVKENTDATKDGSKGDTQTDKTSDASSAIGTSDPVEHHDTDSSDSLILKSVAQV